MTEGSDGATLRIRVRISSRFLPYLLLAPALLFVAAFILYPLGLTFYTSLQHRVLTDPTGNRFVGLANFAAIVRDSTFWLVAKQSTVWVLASLIAQFLLGLGLALLLNERFFARGLYRSLILSPWAISCVIIAIMWKWMYNPQVGVINEVLLRAGLLSHRVAFLADPALALPAVIVTNIWRGTPFFAVMLLAALQAVPRELHEAAAIDGAGGWQRFLRVTMPTILPMVFAALLLRTIWIFNEVDLIFVLTDGGPVRASETLATFLYKKASRDLDFGLGSALAVIMFAILMAITTAYYLAFRRSERPL